MSDTPLTEPDRIEECAVCGEEVEIGGFPPEYYYPLDQSDVPDHKVRRAPNPSGGLACGYECFVEYEGQQSGGDSQ